MERDAGGKIEIGGIPVSLHNSQNRKEIEMSEITVASKDLYDTGRSELMLSLSKKYKISGNGLLKI